MTRSLGVGLILTSLLLVGCPKKDKTKPEDTAIACSDGVDNDGDGDIDCADSDCQGFDVCTETECADGIDNDGDDLIDCQDPDCQPTIECRENTSAACQDGIDNDGDGDIDCDDDECSGMFVCSTESICNDGVDNDNDGATDCDDHPDCDGAPNCGGFCYTLEYDAPALWGMAITEANDDEDAAAPCVQYDVVVSASSPLANTMVCLYLDDMNSVAVGCADPNAQNPMTFRVDLCAGTHMLYARVEQGTEVCDQVNVGLEQIEVEVYENPSCSITLPAGLSTDAANPTCYDQATMDIQVTTTGADAQLWVAGALAGNGMVSGGVVDFPGTALGTDGDMTLNAWCDNPGTGNGDAWSVDYYITKDTQPPAVTIESPTSGATFGAAQCPFTVEVTDIETGLQVCANYVGQTPHANGCATSTGPGQTIPLTVSCIDGADLTVEAYATDSCGNYGSDSILVTADTGLPVVLIEGPADGQLYNKATDTINAGTDALEMNITACTDQQYNPSDVTLLVDNTSTGLVASVQAAACLGLPYRITWSAPFAFSQAVSGLQTPHTVFVEVTDGVNTANATSSFTVDTLAPQVTFNCAGCAPTQEFVTTSDDNCTATVPFEIETRVQVIGLEMGEPLILTVTNGGSSVGASPYTEPSMAVSSHFVAFGGTCGPELQNGQNLLDVNATDQAGNVAIPAQKLVTYGDGTITSPSSGAILSVGDDCPAAGADYGILVSVEVDHISVVDNTSVEVAVSSGSQGWSYPAPGADVWLTDCSTQGAPCTHEFCVPIPTTEVEQTDIAITLSIGGTVVPGGPENITVDISEPDVPANLSRSVLNHRAAEIQLNWDSVEDAQTGLLTEWDIRCVADTTLTTANWSTAMTFSGEPTPATAGTAQSMVVAESEAGEKIRIGSTYSCGIRGRNSADLWSALEVFAPVTQADLAFQQYGTVITDHTLANPSWYYWPSIAPAGDINGDTYDDLLVGYGRSGTGKASTVYFGSSTGPSSPLAITCSDPSFGGAMAGIGDFDNVVYDVSSDNVKYPDIAIASPDEDRVYIFLGHAGFGSTALDCANAEFIIQGPIGGLFGDVIAGIGDFDGDGNADIAVGAPYHAGYSGMLAVVFGRAEATYPLTMDLVTPSDSYGALVLEDASLGAVSLGIGGNDLDKDGFSDVLFSMSIGGTGEIGILRGHVVTKNQNSIMPLDLTDLDQTVTFSGAYSTAPAYGRLSTVPMDFDGDGCADLVVGANGANVGTATAAVGNVFVYHGQMDTGNNCLGTVDSAYSEYVRGEVAWDRVGLPVASMSNMTTSPTAPWRLNGLFTSTSDLAIFAGVGQLDSGNNPIGMGTAALWYAGFTGNKTLSDADVMFAPPSGAVSFFWASFVGDLNGDGYVDLAVGDSGYGTAGRIHLYY